MASTKSVLVQLGDFSRVIQLDSSPCGPATEKELLLVKIRAVYSERIQADDRVTLQRKDDSWGGMFVDFFGDVIEDRSVFKVVVEKCVKVCELLL